MIILFARATEFDFQKYASITLAFISLMVFTYNLYIFIRRIKTKKEVGRIIVIIVSATFVYFGLNGFIEMKDLQNNQKTTLGKTLKIYYPYKGASSIVYEYYVNGMKYEGKASYYPADLKQIKIPNGIYPVIYNQGKPEKSDMDFRYVPKNYFQ